MIPISAAAYLAAGILTLAALGGLDLWHHVKHGARRTGCAAVRVIGHKCAPPAKPKPAPLASTFSDCPLLVDKEADELLSRKLALEALPALTSAQREEYAGVQRAWTEAESRVIR